MTDNDGVHWLICLLLCYASYSAGYHKVDLPGITPAGASECPTLNELILTEGLPGEEG